jgi:hypothetical protein
LASSTFRQAIIASIPCEKTFKGSGRPFMVCVVCLTQPHDEKTSRPENLE